MSPDAPPFPADTGRNGPTPPPAANDASPPAPRPGPDQASGSPSATESALEKETLRRRILMDQSREGMVIIDQDHKVVEANRSFAEMLGYTPQEVLSLHTWDWESVMTEADIRREFANLGAISATFETVHRRKDGATLDVEVSAAGAMVLGEPLIMAVVRDVGERKRFQTALIAAKEQAEAASRSKSEFLANMSHEIRTPLNGIMGMLQVVRTTALDAEQREYLDNALRSTKRLTQLLSDILDLSRIESGKLTMRQAPFSMAALRESVLEPFTLASREKGLDLSFCLDPGLPDVVIGDEMRLRQILFNLIGNALKFTPTGSVRVEVCSLPVAVPGRFRLLFTVRDTGIGIEDALLRKIFEPFEQGDGSYVRNYQGAGLGLAIVRRLVLLMGGDISIESSPGSGTAIHVGLPFGLPPADAKDASERDATDNRHIRILVAEDDEINMRCITGILSKLGHAVTGAVNGREALRLAAGTPFDIILMDIRMPGMDGLEATRRIRVGEAQGVDPRIPIVAMTAHAMAGDREAFLGAGMDGYVAKPMDVSTLCRAIATALGRDGPYPKTGHAGGAPSAC